MPDKILTLSCRTKVSNKQVKKKNQLSLIADTFKIWFICSLILSVGVKNSQRAFSLFFISFISTINLKSVFPSLHQQTDKFSIINWQLPSGSSDSKESTCNVGDLDQEDPPEKEMATHSSILAGESNGQRILVGYSPSGRTKSGKTVHWTIHFISSAF